MIPQKYFLERNSSFAEHDKGKEINPQGPKKIIS
jgi:hypothetical protein